MTPGYKQTAVGMIPDDWAVARLNDFSRIIRGASPRPKGDSRFYGGPVPRLMVEDVTRDGKTVFPQIDSLTVEGAKRSRPCKRGTLTLVCSGTVGIPSFLGVDACIHDGFIAIVDIQRSVSSDYLYYQLERLRLSFESSATHGGVFTNLTTTGVREFEVPLPPSEVEQRAIASALSDVDALLSGLDRLIAKKRDLKQAAMQQLLTGQTRLPGFEGEWEVKRLGDLLTICHGKSQNEVEVNDGAYPILATGGQIGTSKCPLYDKPSVLIGRKGTINQPRYMDTPFWTVDTLFYSAIKDDNSAKFIYYRFCLIDWMQYNEASGVPSLNARTIENIEVDCPKPVEQEAIAKLISDMDAELAALEARREKTRLLKQGMMKELLTGKTRLITPERDDA